LFAFCIERVAFSVLPKRMIANLSIWEKESFYAPQDLVIVGAGLMGLWTALELKQQRPSLRITILERNSIPLGASTRNAGFACFGSPTELLHDADTLGADAMLAVAEMRYRGIQKIRTHFTDEQIGLDACGGYECINRDYKKWALLPDQLNWLNHLLKEITGSEAIFQQTDHKLADMGLQGFDTLIENITEAALHSGKLVQALTQKVQAAGVPILYGIQVNGLDKQPDGMQIHTLQNLIFSAAHVLLCTNAFTSELVPEARIEPARGQVILTSPIPGLPMKGTFHFDEGFYYWRHLDNRILLGGARNTSFDAEATTDLSGSATVREALENFLARHLHPSFQYTIEHHWSGVMGFTTDKRPYTTTVREGITAAIACNGMGVALTPVVAEQLSARLLDYF
jgi:gamma-glutamylputrescine oxidase